MLSSNNDERDQALPEGQDGAQENYAEPGGFAQDYTAAGGGQAKGGQDFIASVKKLFSNEIIRLGSILFAITFVVALMLGFVNGITKDVIEEHNIEATNDAMQAIFPGAAFTELDVLAYLEESGDKTVTGASAAEKGGERVGLCVKVSPKGFGGAIDMIVGVDTDGAVAGFEIISMSETPGLGTKARDSWFADQFTGKTYPVSITKSSDAGANEISAISGATITSTAVMSGVNAALAYAASLG